MKDGGPAFPTWIGYDQSEQTQIPGMSLRDWFAGMALSHPYAGLEDSELNCIAHWAYEVADAMIAEREKGETDGGTKD